MPSERERSVCLSRKAGDCFLLDEVVVNAERVTQQLVVFTMDEQRITVRCGQTCRLGKLPLYVTVREISGATAMLSIESL